MPCPFNAILFFEMQFIETLPSPDTQRTLRLPRSEWLHSFPVCVAACMSRESSASFCSSLARKSLEWKRIQWRAGIPKQKQESWNFCIEHTTGIVSFILERREQSDVVKSYSRVFSRPAITRTGSPLGKYRLILCRTALELLRISDKIRGFRICKEICKEFLKNFSNFRIYYKARREIIFYTRQMLRSWINI